MDYTTGRLSETLHLELVNRSAEQLIKYGAYLLRIERWYEERGLEIPRTTLTNYKDAMFHYKKIYEHSDTTKVLQEQYAMEEHLIRAHKDAIIFYMNIMRQGIECVYYAFSDDEFLGTLPAMQDCESLIATRDETKSKYEEITFDNSKWVIDAINLFACTGLSDIECIKYAFAVYYHKHKHDLKNIKRALQKCIHLITNFSLRLRINGTEIYRPMNDDDYNAECVRIFVTVKQILDEQALGLTLATIPYMYIEFKSKKKAADDSKERDDSEQKRKAADDSKERGTAEKEAKEAAVRQVKEEFLQIYSP